MEPINLLLSVLQFAAIWFCFGVGNYVFYMWRPLGNFRPDVDAQLYMVLGPIGTALLLSFWVLRTFFHAALLTGRLVASCTRTLQ